MYTWTYRVNSCETLLPVCLCSSGHRTAKKLTPAGASRHVCVHVQAVSTNETKCPLTNTSQRGRRAWQELAQPEDGWTTAV